MQQRVGTTHRPHAPGQHAEHDYGAGNHQAADDQRAAIAGRHGVGRPKTIVKRSHSRPAIASRTSAPSMRAFETAWLRSIAANTSAARRPATSPDPSDRHAYDVTTAESGIDR